MDLNWNSLCCLPVKNRWGDSVHCNPTGTRFLCGIGALRTLHVGIELAMIAAYR